MGRRGAGYWPQPPPQKPVGSTPPHPSRGGVRPCAVGGCRETARPALDAPRLDLRHRRLGAWGLLVIYHLRLGRLLGLGPRGDDALCPVAVFNRLPTRQGRRRPLHVRRRCVSDHGRDLQRRVPPSTPSQASYGPGGLRSSPRSYSSPRASSHSQERGTETRRIWGPWRWVSTCIGSWRPPWRLL